MSKKLKVIVAAVAALLAALVAAGDTILPLFEDVVEAFQPQPNPELDGGVLGGFAGTLADEEDAGSPDAG